MIITSDKIMTQNLNTQNNCLFNFEQINVGQTRGRGFGSFFERSIFSRWCVIFCLLSRRSGVYITSSFPVVLCVYILISVHFLLMLMHLPTFFDDRFCIWLWGQFPCQHSRQLDFLFWGDTKYKLILVFLRVNPVHIGFRTLFTSMGPQGQ